MINSRLLARSDAIVGLAKPHCRFDKRIEHPLQIERRAADHLEHVGGGGLLLKRFAIPCSSLSRRVFSMAMTAWLAKFCTSSICLSVKGPNLLTVDADDPDQFILLEHRDAENGSKTAKFDGCHTDADRVRGRLDPP